MLEGFPVPADWCLLRGYMYAPSTTVGGVQLRLTLLHSYMPGAEKCNDERGYKKDCSKDTH
jgi:hypothetical protein